MITVLYVLFTLSVFAPIYTYAIYPLILKLLKAKKYRIEAGFKPQISVAIVDVGSDSAANTDVIKKKQKNLEASDYPADAFDIAVVHNMSELNKFVANTYGEIVLFTDIETEFDEKAIANLVSKFADERIGCVCGQLRKRPDKDGKPTEGAFWKYENLVKRFESGIGRLSGTNSGLYAVRKSILPVVSERIISLDFYISTFVLQAGWDVIMAEDAIAYEKAEQANGLNFEKHVLDGAGYYQALAVFWRMLFPRKGSFVYVSHRVIKWIVPVNLIFAFVINAVLSFISVYMLGLFICQITIYACMVFYYLIIVKNAVNAKGKAVKILSVLFYFIALNIALMSGFFRFVRKQQKSTVETHR